MIKRTWDGIKLILSAFVGSAIGVIGFYITTKSYKEEMDKFDWHKVDGEWRVTRNEDD